MSSPRTAVALIVADQTRPAVEPPRAALDGPVSVHSLAPEAWDLAMSELDEVCQEQSMTFARSRWPGVLQEPLMFRRGSTVIGGCLVMIQPLPLGLGAIAVAKWGPMQRHAEGADHLERYARMTDALVAEYAERRGMMLSILPRASIEPENAEYRHLLERGFRRGASLLFPNRYMVNLQLSESEQRSSLLQKWRYNLHRSEQEGMEFEAAGPERLVEFQSLYRQMLGRKKFPDHSAFDTLSQLMAMKVEALRPQLFFVRHRGEVVAGAVIFKAGERAVYLYGATSEAALELRAGYFLQWNIVGWLRRNSVARWYDLGGTDGFQGLHQFKKGLVGERGVISPVPPVANYAAHWWPMLLGESAFFGRELLHAAKRRIDRLRPDRAVPDQQLGAHE